MNKCKKCNGSCCRAFFLPKNRITALMSHNVLSKKFWVMFYSIIASFVLTKKLPDDQKEFYLKLEIKKDRDTDIGTPLTCRIFNPKTNKCSAYGLRPSYCYEYECGGSPQSISEEIQDVWNDIR